MGKALAALDDNARELLLSSMAWMDRFWDESFALLWSPGDSPDPLTWAPSGSHTVRDSSWYALGLLLRDQSGDSERAARVLDRLLDYQLDAPGQPYHGTFYRAPEEAHPPAEAIEWKHYDPNWREFIFTTLDLILAEYEERLPATLVAKIDAARPKAVAGALARRVRASYTNISLMNAFMLCASGERLRRSDWLAAGEEMARQIYGLFQENKAFEEYNSPTYYGVDIFALALWRQYAPSPILRDLGAEMEADLWRDLAQYYHAGLRNICGPYDRSYGMDMTRYVAVVGEWIYLITGKEQAPLPDLSGRFAHAHDLCFAPLAALLGASPPAAARVSFLSFPGELLIERPISNSPRRVASVWLAENIMIGAQETSRAKRGHMQFHPATIHWRMAGGQIGWIRLANNEPVDAWASRNRLEVEGSGELVFQVNAPTLADEAISATLWRLPGLTVKVETNVATMALARGDDRHFIRFLAEAGRAVRLTLATDRA